MNLKTELIALAVRIIADKTDLIHKPDQLTVAINSFLGVESYDQQLAKSIEKELSKAAKKAKTVSTNRKFKKIVQNV